MSSPTDSNLSRNSPSNGYYVVAGLSFIPLLGVLFGFFSILFGLLTKLQGGKKLAAIGAGGILFTVIIFGSLIYFIQILERETYDERRSRYDKVRSMLTPYYINSLVAEIELYKVQNGKYPESLKVLRDSLGDNSTAFVSAYDTRFHYELVDHDHYYLLGVGVDKTPFTDDDILPQVTVAGQVGLLTDRNRRAHP